MLTCQPHVLASRIHGFCWRKITRSFAFVFLLLEKKITDPFLDLQNSRQALASKKAILASHHFSTGVEDSKGWKKGNLPTPPALQGKIRMSVICRFLPVFLILSFRTKEPIWTQPHWSVPWDHQDGMPSPPSSPCPCKHDWPWGLWCIVMTTDYLWTMEP